MWFRKRRKHKAQTDEQVLSEALEDFAAEDARRQKRKARRARGRRALPAWLEPRVLYWGLY